MAKFAYNIMGQERIYYEHSLPREFRGMHPHYVPFFVSWSSVNTLLEHLNLCIECGALMMSEPGSSYTYQNHRYEIMNGFKVLQKLQQATSLHMFPPLQMH